MSIVYRHDVTLTPEQYADILKRTSLGARRPVDDLKAMAQMLQHAHILITAWDGDVLVGVARSFSDRAYVTYLADLAVDTRYQRRGIGKKLIAATTALTDVTCKTVLFAAPDAKEYYGHVGFDAIPTGWGLARSDQLKM